MIVQCALLKCYTILGYTTETVLLICPFLQTNITVQMRGREGKEGEGKGSPTKIPGPPPKKFWLRPWKYSTDTYPAPDVFRNLQEH